MTFRVEPQAIRILAGHVQEVHHVADAAARYMRGYSDIGTHGTGVLAQALGAHADLVGQIDRMLARLGELTDASAKALRQAAAGYEQTDLDSAAQFDATYPQVLRSNRPFE